MSYINKFGTILNRLIDEATRSDLKSQLSAAIVKGNKFLSRPCANIDRNILRGYTCGSLHAEAHAILDLYGKDLMYSSKNNKFFCANDKKKKCDLIVIRINKEKKLCNSRPCYNCLNMMKAVNIKRVYYSDNSENIICESVKDMISINSSSATRSIDNILSESNKTVNEYFNDLLKRLFPNKVKRNNFEYFINFDLKNIFPNYSYEIEYNKGINVIKIYDINKNIVKESILIN